MKNGLQNKGNCCQNNNIKGVIEKKKTLSNTTKNFQKEGEANDNI